MDMRASIRKWGNSQAIRIPVSLLEDAGLKCDDEVNMFLGKDKSIVIQKKKELTIEELFEGFEGEYDNSDMALWADGVGKEVL